MMENVDPDLPCCRICFQESEPVVKLPCKCKGTLSFVHECCLNDFIRAHEPLDPAEVAPNNRKIMNCQVCKHPMDLEVAREVCWDRLPNIQIEIFLILFVILTLGLVGLQFSEQLVKDAFEHNNGYIEKYLYLFSYIWLIGVVLYLLIEPLISEIKQLKVVIKPNTVLIDEKKTHSL